MSTKREAMDPLTAAFPTLAVHDSNDDIASNCTTVDKGADDQARIQNNKTSGGTGAGSHACSDLGVNSIGNISDIDDRSIGSDNTSSIEAGEAADILLPLNSPRAASSPILVPAGNGFSTNSNQDDGGLHSHFNPNISFPKSSLSPDDSSNPFRAGHPAARLSASKLDDSTLGQKEDGTAVLPPFSPPDPDYDPELLGELLQKHASPALAETRFSLTEFMKDKARLATAARRELGGGHTVTNDDDVGSYLQGSGHDAELSRQAAHLATLTEGVAEESKVNKELATLLVERLDSSRKALECLLKVLTCLMEGEQAYSNAMTAAAKAAAAGPLAAPADSGGLAEAVEGLVQLPAAAAAGHRQLYLELQVLVESVRGLWRRYNTAAKDIKQAVMTARRNVDGCCKQLNLLFSEHRDACEAFDASVVYHSTVGNKNANHHQRAHSSSSVEAVADAWTGAAAVAAAALSLASGGDGGGVLRPRFVAAPSRDPWASEGKLVQEQQALRKCQDQERELLQQGFDTLQALEQERITALLKSGDTLAAAYCSAIQGLPAAAEGLKETLTGLHSTGEVGVQHLAQVAADMRTTNQALAARQADAVSSVSQELFCSPEIVRQGPMELWRPKTSSWESVHFVLTRAGFLHWFKSMDDALPQETPLNLCRCSFEAGQAPVFHLVESGSGSWLVGRGNRKITVQASSVDECCEWAIALREAIALSSSTGAAGSASGGGNKHGSRLSSR